MAKDTIAAIATANAKGAVSLIRVSGDEALQCVSRLMKKDLTKAEGYTIVHGTIYDREEPVDNVLVSVFHAPRSYTGGYRRDRMPWRRLPYKKSAASDPRNRRADGTSR